MKYEWFIFVIWLKIFKSQKNTIFILTKSSPNYFIYNEIEWYFSVKNSVKFNQVVTFSSKKIKIIVLGNEM